MYLVCQIGTFSFYSVLSMEGILGISPARAIKYCGFCKSYVFEIYSLVALDNHFNNAS